MPYRVISFTMAQVRQGALGFQRTLNAVLREHPEIRVYSVSPFDLDERRRFKDRFGGDIVVLSQRRGLSGMRATGPRPAICWGNLRVTNCRAGEALVVGLPERTGNASAK